MPVNIFIAFYYLIMWTMKILANLPTKCINKQTLIGDVVGKSKFRNVLEGSSYFRRYPLSFKIVSLQCQSCIVSAFEGPKWDEFRQRWETDVCLYKLSKMIVQYFQLELRYLFSRECETILFPKNCFKQRRN